MTEVSFHVNVSEPALYACRLLRKATRQGSVVVVTAAGTVLEQLDRALWTFEPADFVPHVLLPAGGAFDSRLRPTKVWLTERPADAPCHEVLVNLGRAAPDGFESFDRLIEIVSNRADELDLARGRWAHYKSRGYALKRHEAAD